MKPDIRINVLILIFYIIGVMACLWYLYGVAPLLNWGIVAALFAISVVEAAIVLALFHMGKMPFRAHGNGDIILNNRTIWLANIPIISALWLLFPYAPLTLLMVYTILSLAATSDFMIRSITRPPSRQFTCAGPSMILLSNALYAVTHSMPFAAIIAVTNLILCATFLLMKWQVQSVLYDLYLTRIAAETARDEAEQSRDARMRFLAAASHDLAQPLQAARMFADTLIRQPAGAKRDKAITNLGWAFDSTQSLLDQMLDHLRTSGGTSEIHMGHVAIGSLIAQIAAMHEPHAAAIGASINALPSSLIARADARLVERTISNFTANALRHAHARRILVGARRHGPRLRIWVIDDGVGVSARDAARLFDDNFQGSDHGDEVRGGFGLGLASARRAGELIGGTVGFDQRWKKGSAFYLELGSVADNSLGGENLLDL